jgi:hypothetical protein
MFPPMRRWHLILLALALATRAWADDTPQAAQPTLPAIPLTIAGKTLTAEVADTEKERETGLMFRKGLADGTGMLFVFDVPQHVDFWMKNTLVPLSVAYVNPAGMIMEIHDMQAKDEHPVPSQFDSIAYALEVPQGWFTNNGIMAGTSISGLPQPRQGN